MRLNEIIAAAIKSGKVESLLPLMGNIQLVVFTVEYVDRSGVLRKVRKINYLVNAEWDIMHQLETHVFTKYRAEKITGLVIHD